MLSVLLLAAAWPAAPVAAAAWPAAQEPAPPSIGQLMATLRKRDLEWFARDRVVSELLDRGVEGARPLAKYAAAQLQELDKDWRKDAERYLEGFGEAAAELVVARQPRGADKEIATLREEALAVSRGENLTKERIHEEIDPRLARLRELLRITPQELRGSDDKLDARREELEDLADALDMWANIWQESSALLAADEAGADALRRIKTPPETAGRMDALDAEQLWLTVLATPMDERDRRTLLQNREIGAALPLEEAAGILYHNRIRIELGLHAQAIDLKLCEAGRGHSTDMRDHGFFAHESPVDGKKTPGDRARLAGTSGSAENIARGQRSGAAAVDAWWYSPGHHRNMLSGASRIGLGNCEDFWTEMFG